MSNNYILTSSGYFVSEDELYHYGIKGMKWGVRKYQNEDGSLTSAGKSRYATVADAKEHILETLMKNNRLESMLCVV